MELVLFGAGKLCREAIEVLEEKGNRPDCIVDNDAEKVGMDVYGIPVISFEDFKAGDNVKCHILITVKSKYVDEICKQLKENNFKNFKVYEQTRKWGASANHLLRDDWVINKLKSITGGNRCLTLELGSKNIVNTVDIYNICLRIFVSTMVLMVMGAV